MGYGRRDAPATRPNIKKTRRDGWSDTAEGAPVHAGEDPAVETLLKTVGIRNRVRPVPAASTGVDDRVSRASRYHMYDFPWCDGAGASSANGKVVVLTDTSRHRRERYDAGQRDRGSCPPTHRGWTGHAYLVARLRTSYKKDRVLQPGFIAHRPTPKAPPAHHVRLVGSCAGRRSNARRGLQVPGDASRRIWGPSTDPLHYLRKKITPAGGAAVLGEQARLMATCGRRRLPVSRQRLR